MSEILQKDLFQNIFKSWVSLKKSISKLTFVIHKYIWSIGIFLKLYNLIVFEKEYILKKPLTLYHNKLLFFLDNVQKINSGFFTLI